MCTFNSRRIKQKLYEHTLTDPSENTRAKYRNFCKIYFKTIRAAKKLYYSRLITNHAKDVKKPGVFLMKYLAGVDQIILLKRSTFMAQLLQIQ